MKEATLDARLRAAAEYVRQGAVFADIGTDHAYLPIYLLQRKIISRAVAADVAEGPLNCAVSHAKEFSLEDKIDFHLTDGLTGLEGLGITDVAICGMGGELISMLIDRAPFLKNTNIRLILQPMSKQELLRAYLAKNGFRIQSERVGIAAGHTYSCICAEYSGEPYELDRLSLYVGEPIIETEQDRKSFALMLDKKEKAFKKRLDGKKMAGESTEYEDALLTGVESRATCPVRIPRGDDFQSEIRGLYPIGEGAGYAGGITSAAIDGIRVALKIMEQFSPVL